MGLAFGREGKINVTFCRGDAERLPLRSASVTVALVNGIFNLNPAGTEIFHELARVGRPGGAVYAAEAGHAGGRVQARALHGAEWFA